MTRITDKDLDLLCHELNTLTGSPLQPWSNGKSNIGNYHISHAYGGVCLHRISNEGGGVRCPLSQGHGTKRELYNAMQSFIAGLEHSKRVTA